MICSNCLRLAHFSLRCSFIPFVVHSSRVPRESPTSPRRPGIEVMGHHKLPACILRQDRAVQTGRESLESRFADRSDPI